MNKRNKSCRFYFVFYIWSESDKNLYDRFEEFSRRVWKLNKHTFMISLSFLRVQWQLNHFLQTIRITKSNLKRWQTRTFFLIICNAMSYTIMRVFHDRFVVFSDQLSFIVLKFRNFQSKKKFLNRFQVNQSDLSRIILNMLNDQTFISIDIHDLNRNSIQYVCNLKNVIKIELKIVFAKDDAFSFDDD